MHSIVTSEQKCWSELEHQYVYANRARVFVLEIASVVNYSDWV